LSFLALGYALASSLSWGAGDFVSGVKSRTLGVFGVLLPAQLAGLAIAAAIVAARGEPWPGAQTLWAVPAAFAGTLGLVAFFRGMIAGAISVVAPIAGVSAIVPVIFGIATGDHPSVAQLVGIACALAGVGLASVEHHEGRRRVAAGVGLALLAACGFGFYFPWMHAAGKVDFWWASFLFRAMALVIVAAIVAQQRTPIRMSRRNAVIACLVGLGDTLGNVLYAAAAGTGGLISLTSVLASLYPVVTVLLAASVLKERIAVTQRAGVALTLAGVVLISV